VSAPKALPRRCNGLGETATWPARPLEGCVARPV